MENENSLRNIDHITQQTDSQIKRQTDWSIKIREQILDTPNDEKMPLSLDIE